VNSSIRFDAIRHTWNLGIARPSRSAVIQPDGGWGASSSAPTAPMRSLPEHSYAKLKQRDDKSLVLTFLDWGRFPCRDWMSGVWHQTDLRKQPGNVRYSGMNGSSSDALRGPSLTLSGHQLLSVSFAKEGFVLGGVVAPK
jgi:hypothetical protein